MLNSADFLLSVFHHCLMVKNNAIVIGHGSATKITQTLKPDASSMQNLKTELDWNKLPRNIRLNNVKRTCD